MLLKMYPTKGTAYILGGDNYRIGMEFLSIFDTGIGNAIEFNAIQRSNPEMQKRAANAIRAEGGK